MDCRTAQKQYIAFIHDQLDIKNLSEFLKHMESCEECREEYEIYYMMTFGMRLLENDSGERMIDSAEKLRFAKDYLRKYWVYRIEKWIIFLLVLMSVVVFFVE